MLNLESNTTNTLLDFLNSLQNVNSLTKSDLREDIYQRYGADLALILGPKAKRVPLDQISEADLQSRLEKVSEQITAPMHRNGNMVRLKDAIFELMDHLENCKALWGIELPIFDHTPMLGTMKWPIDMLWLNYGSQRCIYARHIVRLIFKFDPSLVFSGVGRLTTDMSRIFINDAQHRILACVMLGIDDIAVQVKISDDPVDDINQFCALNIDNLPSEPYDDLRNRNNRGVAFQQAGKPVYKDDRAAMMIWAWAHRFRFNICRNHDTQRELAGGIGHVDDLWKAFRIAKGNEDLYNAAGYVMKESWPSDKVCTANLIGLIWWLREQASENGAWATMGSDELKDLIKILRYKFDTSTSFHHQAKKAMNVCNVPGKIGEFKYVGGVEYKVGLALDALYKARGQFKTVEVADKNNECPTPAVWFL